MSDDFDDLPSGSGEPPTKDQVVAVHRYLRAHNRPFKTKNVLDEMIALGFTTSRAAVGRALVGAEGREKPKIERKKIPAEERQERKRLNNRHEHKKAPKPEAPRPDVAAAAAKLDPDTLGQITGRMLALLSKNGEHPVQSSTQLAIEENRVSMALNIVIAETMAARPEILLLDMRGTAALVDALTVARKLSGGPSIDISVPVAGAVQTNGVSPNGHAMKEINPSNGGLASELSKWRREKAAEERVQRN